MTVLDVLSLRSKTQRKNTERAAKIVKNILQTEKQEISYSSLQDKCLECDVDVFDAIRGVEKLQREDKIIVDNYKVHLNKR